MSIVMPDDSLLHTCDAIDNLLDHRCEVHEDGDDSIWSIGTHCLSRLVKYQGYSFEDLLHVIERFHSANASPQVKKTKSSALKKWVKRIWDESPSHVPCLELRDLIDENGDPFCEGVCIKVGGKMYQFARRESERPNLVKLKSREKELKEFVKISNGMSGMHLVNVEPGVGKTVAILKQLARTKHKVLYLAPRQELLEEIKDKYLTNRGKSEDIFIYKGIISSTCIHKEHIAELMERGVPYRHFCKSKCEYLNKGQKEREKWENCDYRNQRPIAASKKILLMATPALINQKLIDSEELDNNNRSIVVFDEDHLQQTSVETQISKEALVTNIKFMRKVIDQYYYNKDINRTLDPLIKTANKLLTFLSDDKKPAPSLILHPSGENKDEINLRRVGISIYENAYRHKRFHSFLYDIRHLCLHGGTAYRRTGSNGQPVLCLYRKLDYPRDRTYYFLDGAAEVSLYEQLFPGIRVLKKDDQILKPFSDAKIIQYVENSFSKSSLTRTTTSKMGEVQDIIRAILNSKRYASHKVGIIVKKEVEKPIAKFISEAFPKRKPKPVIKHFGDITGVDDFKEYPVGIIVGMHSLYFTDYARESVRLFGQYTTAEHWYRWDDIFSEVDYTYRVKNPVFRDSRVYSIFKQFCIGATIQAVGRWRPYRRHRRKFCDIFLLNNYNTGLPVHPMRKDELFKFLEVPSGKRPKIKTSDKIAEAATAIMECNGRVKNSDIREATGFDKVKVSKHLRRYAQKMKWIQDRDYYYYELR
jgi:hypothetical protein